VNATIVQEGVPSPSVQIEDRFVVARGKWYKMATVFDEEWIDGDGVADPEAAIKKIKNGPLKADIFTFAQKLPRTEPLYGYYMEWDNVAAIQTDNYKEWWENRLPQVTRKSIRRAAKRGATARVVEYTDDLVRGIMGIHDDTLTRQGAPFAHYGKPFDVVKREYGTYPEKSEFIGAYYEDELIGIIKLVYADNTAGIMQIITKTKHYDRRPTNILIAKAVEVCEQKKISFLIYGKYVYGNKTDSSLTEFKRRNGFEQINFPRYYIPLTIKGKFIIKSKLHRGLLGVLPGRVISSLRAIRSAYYEKIAIPLMARRKGDPSAKNEKSAGGTDEAD
jgi:hypothetical protein